MQPGRIGFECLPGVDHWWQFGPLEGDGLRGVFGERAALGDHQRNRFSDPAHPIARQRPLQRGLHVWQVREQAADRLAMRGERFAVVGSHHAFHAQRRREVQLHDHAVRNRAAQERGMQQSVGGQVVDIGTGASHESPGLGAHGRLSDRARTQVRAVAVRGRAAHGTLASVPASPRRRRAASSTASTMAW